MLFRSLHAAFADGVPGIDLDEAWDAIGEGGVQGNLDPVLLFAEWKELRERTARLLDSVTGRPGHIFNLGHGILPSTPVENVKALAEFVHEYTAKARKPAGAINWFGETD